MKHVNRFWQVVLVLLIALIVLACNGQALMALPTPKSNTSIVPTITAVPTIIAAPINTAVSGPKITLIHLAIKLPPAPTPMPMGTPVSIGDYQVNVMYMRTLNSVYLDRLYAWFPKDGDMYVELGVKVTNLKPGNNVSVRWGDIRIVEESGNSIYPNWGESKPVASRVKYNPRNLVFRRLENPDELVTFDQVLYLRAIWGTEKLSPTILLFGFGESPLIKVVVP